MTRHQAQIEARKRWGANAYIRAHESVSSAERRQSAKERHAETVARIQAIDDEVNARLEALDWYQALMAERKELRTIRDKHDGMRFYKKFAVGTSSKLWNEIKGSGDTWEEAFAEADRNRKASA